MDKALNLLYFCFWCKYRGLYWWYVFSSSRWTWVKAQIYKMYTFFPPNELETQSW